MKIELCVSLVAEVRITIDSAANVRSQERGEDLVVRRRQREVVLPHGVTIDNPLPRQTGRRRPLGRNA